LWISEADYSSSKVTDARERQENDDNDSSGSDSSVSTSGQPTSARTVDVEGINLDGEDSENEDLFRRILAAATARGIPLDFLAHMHRNGEDEEDDEDVQYPFEHSPQSLQHVAEFIQSENCKNIIILAGAGMSVASGIPDFRSSNGLYATLNADLLTADPIQRERIRHEPTYCLDQHLFLTNPLPCLEVNREFILGVRDRKWKATLAHRFVELLQTQTGKLCRLYTQNIDGLEDQCLGLSHAHRIAVHGSMDEAACAACDHETPFEDFCSKVERQIKDITGQDLTAPKESTPIVCESCGAPAVKPNIVLFRSSLPKEFFQKVPNDVKHADLLIVMGTSLHVAPANSLVWRAPKSAMRVLLNREPVGWHLGMDFEQNDRDFFGQGNCENVALELMEHLGWLDKLKPLLEKSELPESSCALLREQLQAHASAPDTTDAKKESTTDNNDS
jgi:NAD-dependent deacetylase sirtuin 2